MGKYNRWQDYPSEDLAEMRSLLSKWKMPFLLDIFVDHFITIKVLELLRKDQIYSLITKDFPIGVQMLFTHELLVWQKFKKECTI